MTKFIGIKELQTNTKKIREETGKGVSFVVIYRSKPVFEIKPIQNEFNFAEAMESTGLYNENFIKHMKEAEDDVNAGNVDKYNSTEEFLKSLSK